MKIKNERFRFPAALGIPVAMPLFAVGLMAAPIRSPGAKALWNAPPARIEGLRAPSEPATGVPAPFGPGPSAPQIAPDPRQPIISAIPYAQADPSRAMTGFNAAAQNVRPELDSAARLEEKSPESAYGIGRRISDALEGARPGPGARNDPVVPEPSAEAPSKVSLEPHGNHEPPESVAVPAPRAESARGPRDEAGTSDQAYSRRAYIAGAGASALVLSALAGLMAAVTPFNLAANAFLLFMVGGLAGLVILSTAYEDTFDATSPLRVKSPRREYVGAVIGMGSVAVGLGALILLSI